MTTKPQTYSPNDMRGVLPPSPLQSRFQTWKLIEVSGLGPHRVYLAGKKLTLDAQLDRPNLPGLRTLTLDVIYC